MSFCVKCGVDGPVFENVCRDCFLKDKKFASIPDHVDMPQCSHCREFSIANKWLLIEDVEIAARDLGVVSVQVLKEAVIDDVTATVIPADLANFRVHLNVKMDIRGLAVEEKLDTIVRVKNSVCGRCSKIKGSYFESTLQIRSRDRKLTEKEVDVILDRVHKMVAEYAADNREVFISKVDRMVGGSGGADVLLSSNSVGKVISRAIADQYGAEVKDTAKLLTKKEGRDVFRVTYLVRLPSFRYGDVMLFRGKMYLVGPMRTTSTRLTNMKTNENTNFSNNDLMDAKVIGQHDDMIDAVVLTETPKEIQIMHPTSFKMVELKKPPKFEVKGETVKVFIYEEEIYLLPK
jgi:nonsense-mediated mRNA decay protein 3